MTATQSNPSVLLQRFSSSFHERIHLCRQSDDANARLSFGKLEDSRVMHVVILHDEMMVRQAGFFLPSPILNLKIKGRERSSIQWAC